jgi:hypothetical protein
MVNRSPTTVKALAEIGRASLNGAEEFGAHANHKIAARE